MAGDDLDAPLGYRSGRDGDSSNSTRDIPWGAVALGGMGVIAISLVAFVAVTESRKASMTQAIAIIDPVAPRKIAAPDLPQQSASRRDEDQVTQVARAARAAGSQVEVESGVRVVRRGAPDMPDAMIIRVPQEELKTSLAPAPDDRLIGPGRTVLCRASVATDRGLPTFMRGPLSSVRACRRMRRASPL